MRVELQPAFILHTRPFRDSSLIIDCLTRDHGRLSLLAKGARSQKSRQRQMLQPFLSLSISWQGKSDLKTLTHVEAFQGHSGQQLLGHFLYSGFYINELLVRLLPEKDPHGQVFQLYEQVLAGLYEQRHLESQLRHFELHLLQQLGYSVQLDCDYSTGEKILPEQYYRFVAEHGLQRLAPESDPANAFLGAHLLAIAEGDFREAEVLSAAKLFSRMALHPYLGNKPLQSRKLFTDMTLGGR